MKWSVWLLIPRMWFCNETGIVTWDTQAAAMLWMRDNLEIPDYLIQVTHTP